MKKKQYEKPSVEVAELKQCEALLQVSGSDEIFRPDYGDAEEDVWEDAKEDVWEDDDDLLKIL